MRRNFQGVCSSHRPSEKTQLFTSLENIVFWCACSIHMCPQRSVIWSCWPLICSAAQYLLALTTRSYSTPCVQVLHGKPEFFPAQSFWGLPLPFPSCTRKARFTAEYRVKPLQIRLLLSEGHLTSRSRWNFCSTMTLYNWLLEAICCWHEPHNVAVTTLKYKIWMTQSGPNAWAKFARCCRTCMLTGLNHVPFSAGQRRQSCFLNLNDIITQWALFQLLISLALVVVVCKNQTMFLTAAVREKRECQRMPANKASLLVVCRMFFTNVYLDLYCYLRYPWFPGM